MRESTEEEDDDEEEIGTKYQGRQERERERERGREKKKVIDSRVTDKQTDRDRQIGTDTTVPNLT